MTKITLKKTHSFPIRKVVAVIFAIAIPLVVIHSSLSPYTDRRDAELPEADAGDNVRSNAGNGNRGGGGGHARGRNAVVRTLEENCDVKLELWDARKNSAMTTSMDDGMIELCSAKAFTMEIHAPCSTSATMKLTDYNNGTQYHYRVDDQPPFMLAGEGTDGDVFAVKTLKTIGKYRLSVKTSDGQVTLFTLTVVNCFDYRFSKVRFMNEATATEMLPLGIADYPMRGDLADTLQRESRAHSVITMDDYELQSQGLTNIDKYINASGGIPDYPSDDPNSSFWVEFRHVVNVQIKRRQDVEASSLMKLPLLWENFTVYDVAEAVHDEYPGLWPANLLMWLFRQNAELDYDILPFRSFRDFIGYEFRLADLNTWATGVVSPINFRAKWEGGYPRPEEIAWLIASGKWTTETHRVPADIVEKIMAMNLGKATDFTAYPEGSPPHPSWPAMHSAASSASMWMSVVLKLTNQQYCEALRMDYAVSYARTVAGVHYRTDNIAGLNMGQFVLAEKLADHLVTKYGANRQAVEDKINRVRFDWANYNPADCPQAP